MPATQLDIFGGAGGIDLALLCLLGAVGRCCLHLGIVSSLTEETGGEYLDLDLGGKPHNLELGE